MESLIRKVSVLELTLILLFTLAYLAPIIGTETTQGQQSESGWIVGSPMPTPRTEVTSVGLGDGIYIIGGFNSTDRNSAIVEMYNITSNSWKTNIAPLPVPLHHASSVSFQNKIYVIGGYLGDSTPSDRLYVYDPITNLWTQGYSMPTPRGSPNANIVNGKLYVIGGDLNDRSLNVVESYNPNTNQWTTKSPMPTSRHHAASAVVGGNVYVIGGRLDSSYEGTDIVEKYDPISDEWTKDLGPMPSKRSGIVAASINGSIYVVGGERREGTFDNNERYNPSTDTWTIETPMLTGRHGLGVTAIGDKMYVIGGGPSPGLSVSWENEIYNLNRMD